MEETQSFRFFNRGLGLASRLAIFVLLSLLLMFVDARLRYLDVVRQAVSVVTYPLQRVLMVPGDVWGDVSGFVVLQNNLVSEDAKLRRQVAADAVRLQELQSIKAENQHLRELLTVEQHADYPMQPAEIVYAERDVFRRKLFLSKGMQANVQAGQVVVDDIGVVGQVTRVYPLLSEVTLITDKDHAVPVQVLRSGFRAVVFGSGDTGDLTLRYIPASADIKEGDVLLTSGIDGTYPPGLPVAKIEHVERDPAFPFLHIQCVPVAGVDRHKELLILSGLAKLPELPASSVEATDKSRHGKRSKP
jgi:rod shape-determining protein MreC